MDVKGELLTPDLFIMEKFLQAQKESKVCPERASSAGDPQSRFYYDRYGGLVQKIETRRAMQRILLQRLCLRLLRLAH